MSKWNLDVYKAVQEQVEAAIEELTDATGKIEATELSEYFNLPKNYCN